ncbi:unnamed protein product [Lota lota]
MSCLTMTLGALSNITALGILAKSQVRFRRQTKAPFLLLAGALLLADLGGHMIPGAFSMYLHMAPNQNLDPRELAKDSAGTKAFCRVFGASMVFFGLCPLLLGCAMAAERYVGISQPLLHAAVVTVARVRLAVMLLSSLALLLAVLPLLDIGSYTTQFPGTWCFLPIHGTRSTADTCLALAFSGLGLAAVGLSLLCNILSGLVLLQARVNYKSVKAKKCEPRSKRRTSSSSTWVTSCCSLDVEMMAQLAAITVVSLVCWTPFLVSVASSILSYLKMKILLMEVTEGKSLLGLRMASWNQILDPWIYILLRKAVLRRVCCAFETNC